MSLSSTGLLCGIPTDLGAFNFVVRVTDGSGAQDTSGFSVVVFSDGGLAVLSTDLPPATVSAAYGVELLATRGTAPYSWRLAQGSLPEGLTLFDSGTITGTTSQVGLASFIIELSDAEGEQRLAALSIDVLDPNAVTANPTPEDGCGCTAVEASTTRSGWGDARGPFTLLLAFGIWAWRRRRRV